MPDKQIQINLPLEAHEVPELRGAVGWERRDNDYPLMFERCNFWAGGRAENGQLAAFGYIAGPGLVHGYLEDVIVHPAYQRQGWGTALVKKLLQECERTGLTVVTVTFAEQHSEFYKACGFRFTAAGLWTPAPEILINEDNGRF